MEHPVTRAPASSDAGVTLIELLIVVAVLSVLVVGIGLSTGRGAVPVQSDQARFQDRFETARSLAVHGGLPRGFDIEPQGLRQMRYGPDGWRSSPSLTRWRGRVTYRVQAGIAGTATPAIVFLPNGQTTAFSISFVDDGRITRCTSDGWTGLQCRGG